MKLLLTSAGLSNQSIANALFDLTGEKPGDTSVIFIPTASNVERGDKDWLINDLINLKKQNFKSINIADISAVEEAIWKPQIEKADVIYFEGGSDYHLMKWLNKSKLANLLPELLKKKVYVGVSAGSMVACKNLVLKIDQQLYEEDLDQTEGLAGLNLVDFYVLPHLNSFEKVKEEFIKEVVQDMPEKVYALDDNSALKVIDGKVEIISEGEWLAFNE